MPSNQVRLFPVLPLFASARHRVPQKIGSAEKLRGITGEGLHFPPGAVSQALTLNAEVKVASGRAHSLPTHAETRRS